MLGKGRGGLCKAPTREERKRKANRRERERERDKIKFIGFRFERGQFVGFGKGRRQDVP